MKAPRLVLFSSLAIALAAGTQGCDSNGKARTPFQPTPDMVDSVFLEGPDTVAPGGTAQFRATVRMPNGRVTDITNEASWFAGPASVVSVDRAGMVTAHDRGDGQITAMYQARQALKNVVIVPSGTYRVSGVVTEAGLLPTPVEGARVEVTSGIGAGLSTTTAKDGRYGLFGVAGGIEVRVTKDAFHPRVLNLVVNDHRVQNIEMTLVRPRDDVTGTYTLTVAAASECAQALPEEIRRRTYSALLSANGPDVTVKLSGGSFFLSRSGRGDSFHGRLDPDRLIFTLSQYVYRYYGYAQYPDLIERLASGWFVLDGSVVTGTHSPLSGALNGAFQFYKQDPSWGAFPDSQCKGNHQFVLARVGS